MQNRNWTMVPLITSAVIIFIVSGCVERRLTINTEPQGAVVTLNDEEIGPSPVTVSFEWYGDYNIRISKDGFETLKTHRKLKGPWYDRFPFDFFAQVVNPKRIVDSYEWTFKLEEKKATAQEDLIKAAQKMQQQIHY